MIRKRSQNQSKEKKEAKINQRNQKKPKSIKGNKRIHKTMPEIGTQTAPCCDIIEKLNQEFFKLQEEFESFKTQDLEWLKKYQQKHQKKFRGVVQQFNCFFQTSQENYWVHFDFDPITQSYPDADEAGRRDNLDSCVNMWIDGKTDIIKPSNVYPTWNLYSCWINTHARVAGNERYVAFMHEHFKNCEEDGYVPNYDMINDDNYIEPIPDSSDSDDEWDDV